MGGFVWSCVVPIQLDLTADDLREIAKEEAEPSPEPLRLPPQRRESVQPVLRAPEDAPLRLPAKKCESIQPVMRAPNVGAYGQEESKG